MNATQTFDAEAATLQAYGDAIAYVMMISYFIGLTWVVVNWGNRPGARAWTTVGMIVAPPPQPTDWRRVGTVVFSPTDVNPPILQKAPLYERTYASGKQSWRYWDDLTEEWSYTNAYPPHVLYD